MRRLLRLTEFNELYFRPFSSVQIAIRASQVKATERKARVRNRKKRLWLAYDALQKTSNEAAAVIRHDRSGDFRSCTTVVNRCKNSPRGR